MERLYIFVSGPYRSLLPEGIEHDKEVERNIAAAEAAAAELAARGHIPVVPHRILKHTDGEKTDKWTEEVCLAILDRRRCDAILMLPGYEGSKGSKPELERAQQQGLTVYRSVNEVPVFPSTPPPAANENGVQGRQLRVDFRLKEYEDCAESYRHTYQTVWQACAAMLAIGAALLAFAGQRGTDPAVRAYLVLAAGLSYLFWYVGIFQRMNWYGEIRARCLVQLGKRLAELTREETPFHYPEYQEARGKGASPSRWRDKHIFEAGVATRMAFFSGVVYSAMLAYAGWKLHWVPLFEPRVSSGLVLVGGWLIIAFYALSKRLMGKKR